MTLAHDEAHLGYAPERESWDPEFAARGASWDDEAEHDEADTCED